MTEVIVIQGRELSYGDIDSVRDLMSRHTEWGRTRLSKELCRQWNWRNHRGQLKDMAARTLLVKLERAGHIQLPPQRTDLIRRFHKRATPAVEHSVEPIRCALHELQPLGVSVVESGSKDLHLFNCLLNRFHYLGHRNTVGENLRYLIRDRYSRPVACLLFGSAAWKCADRDAFIGWERGTRERNLQRLTNNTRFLVLPWVVVPHLASHVLGLIVRRIRSDWQHKYGHQVYALETFVSRDRFKGTCYRAANWLRLGSTRGRTRDDRDHNINAAIKDVYLYPLVVGFRQELSA